MNLIVNNLTLDSREVAEMISKEHKNLLRDVTYYINVLEESSKLSPQDFFIKSEYLSKQNKKLPCYKLTKKGCEFVANKLTGEKGILFTATYINKFHEMENQLNHPQPVIKRLYWNNQPFYLVDFFYKKTLDFLLCVTYNNICSSLQLEKR